MEFEKIKKKKFNRPTYTGERGSDKGKQKYFKVGLSFLHVDSKNSRLGICSGWYESLLVSQVILLVLS